MDGTRGHQTDWTRQKRCKYLIIKLIFLRSCSDDAVVHCLLQSILRYHMSYSRTRVYVVCSTKHVNIGNSTALERAVHNQTITLHCCLRLHVNHRYALLAFSHCSLLLLLLQLLLLLCICTTQDIWSMGATMIEMSTAHRPWPAFSNNLAAMFHVATAKAPPPIPDSLSSEARSFLQNCLQLDPVSSVERLFNGFRFDALLIMLCCAQ
jgi:hypothetical protein